MKGKEILLQLRNVLQAFQFSRSHTHRYKISLSKGRSIIFPRGVGEVHDFQEAVHFFLPSIERLQFFSSTHCADNFYRIPQISHNMVGLCRQFFQMHLWGRQFFQMHLWGRQYISAIFLMQTIFPNRNTPLPPLRKNNGPSYASFLC